jgi:hypothetical protein
MENDDQAAQFVYAFLRTTYSSNVILCSLTAWQLRPDVVIPWFAMCCYDPRNKGKALRGAAKARLRSVIDLSVASTSCSVATFIIVMPAREL